MTHSAMGFRRERTRRSLRMRELASLLALAATMAANVSQADIGPIGASPGTKEPGTNQIEMDNPVIFGDVDLWASQTATRTSDNRWTTYNFVLDQQVTAATDLTTSQGSSPAAQSGAWPEEVGDTGAWSQLAWELHGINLGTEDATIQVQSSWYEPTFSPSTGADSDSAAFKLTPYTHLVPVQVVVVVPNYSAPALSNTMSQVSLDSQLALWEDRWSGVLTGISHPGGENPILQGLWTTLTTPTREAEGTFRRVQNALSPIDYVRPDDVFVQCGIQYRLVDYVQVPMDQKHVEFLDGGQGVCGDDARRALLNEVLQAAQSTPHTDLLGKDLPGLRRLPLTVVFNYRSFNTTGHSGDCDSAQETEGFTSGSAVLMGVADNTGVRRDLALSHQLGHALGMAHPDAAGYCVDSASDNLMCTGPDHTSTRLLGCNHWWPWFLTYHTPTNCNMSTVEEPVGADCHAARTGAASLAQAGWWGVKDKDVCGDADGNGDPDDDGDGLVDEDCLFRFLFVRMCYQGTDQQFQQDTTSHVNFLMKSVGLDACPESVVTEWIPQADVDLAPTCPTNYWTGGFMLDVKAAVEGTGRRMADYTEVIAFTNDINFIGFDTAGISYPGIAVDAVLVKHEPAVLVGPVTGNLFPIVPEHVLSHEFGHMLHLSDEYANHPAAINPLEARLGCDPANTNCCYTVSSGATYCEGNETRFHSGRCIMGALNAGTVVGQPAPLRDWCEDCYNHLKQLPPTSPNPMVPLTMPLDCSTAFEGLGPYLNVWGQVYSSGRASKLGGEFVDNARPALGTPGASGEFELRIEDASGFAFYRTRFDIGASSMPSWGTPLVVDPQPLSVRAPLPSHVNRTDHLPVVVSRNGADVSRTTINGVAPTADAGSDQTVECEPNNAELDATASSDGDGDLVQYRWTGTNVTFDDPTSATPVATVPLGNNTLTLEASDGMYSAQDTVQVTVVDTKPPVFGALPVIARTVCDPSSAVTQVPVPRPAVSDVCSADIQVTGEVIMANGAPVALPITDWTVMLPVGTYTIQWTAADPSGNTAMASQTMKVVPAIYASDTIDVRDRAQLRTTTGDYAALANLGTTQTMLGVSSHSGTIESRAAVTLRNSAQVHGNVVTQGSIEFYPGASVSGVQQPHTSVELPVHPGLDGIVFSGGSDVSVEEGTITLAPGSYGIGWVNTDARLVLAAGDYFFSQLLLESDSTLELPGPGVRIFVESQLTSRASWVDAAGHPVAVEVGVAGTNPVWMESAFVGNLLAPNAEVKITKNYAGSVLAKGLLIEPDVVFTCVSDGTGFCTSLHPSGFCPEDGNGCTSQSCTNAGCAYPNQPDGAQCNDGDACTTGDQCGSGTCAGTPLSCDDANPCTADTCEAGNCQHGNRADLSACSDNNACTVGESCHGGNCSGGTSVDCSDGNDCTTDSCSPSTGCQHNNKNNGTSCNDSNACTTGEVCTLGSCGGGISVNCSDSNDCTTDSCNPSIGCQHGNRDNGTVCNDGNACTTGDICTNGSCAGTLTTPAPATGLGASGGNNNAVTLTWTASSTAGVTYTIRRGTSPGSYGTTVVTGVTASTYVNTGLTAGTTYYYVVIAVGCSSSVASNEASAVPSGAPTVSITSPANSASFMAPATILINAAASDPGGSVSKVEFYRGGTLLSTDTTAPYSYSWSNVAAGNYGLTAKAYDNQNASTTSSVVNVVVSSASNPCAGLCNPAIVKAGPSIQSGNLGTGAICHETTSNLAGGNCSNMTGRTLKVNGTTMNCGGWTLPPKRNGGYCMQVTAGGLSYASYATW